MKDIVHQMETRKNSNSRWALRDLIGRFNHSATGDSVVNKGEMWVYMVPLKSVLMLNPLLPWLNW